LVDEVNKGKIRSWDELDERVKSFFTSDRMDKTESMVHGWIKMASFTDGILRMYVAA